MSFTVNYAGEEKAFRVKERAIDFMDGLDDGADLWCGSTLVRSRIKQPGGEFKIDIYEFDETENDIGC